MKYQRHQSISVINGKFKGLAGECLSCDDEAKQVTVKIEGVRNNKPIKETAVLNFNQVRAL